jgi:hypothetical protein
MIVNDLLGMKGGVRMASMSKRAIWLSGLVGEDRQLKVDLPDEVQPGQVDLIIVLPDAPAAGPDDDKLSRLQARLVANGQISRFRLPDPTAGSAPLTDAQLLELGTLPSGARASHELINEDREDRV